MFNVTPFRYCILFCLLGIFFSTVALAQPTAALNDTIRQLQQKYERLHSIEFDFLQLTQTNGRTKEGKGHAAFCRPEMQGKKSEPANRGVIRWNYLEPTEQVIINDGRNLSIYTPEDKQLVVSSVEEMDSDITYSLFTGTKNLLEEFEPFPPDADFHVSPSSSADTVILLSPRKPHSQLKRVQLWLGKDLSIDRLLMEDHFGSLTELSFTAIRFNTIQGDKQQLQTLLKLDLLPGTETIRQ